MQQPPQKFFAAAVAFRRESPYIVQMYGDFLTTAFQRLGSRISRDGMTDDDSEDALQEAFCRLWIRRDTIADASKAEGMLATASRNIRIDNFRRRAAHPTCPVSELGETAFDTDSTVQTELYSEIDRAVRSALSERDREIFLRRDRDGWEFGDIAERYGLSQANVRMIVSRARKAVREVYRKQQKER